MMTTSPANESTPRSSSSTGDTIATGLLSTLDEGGRPGDDGDDDDEVEFVSAEKSSEKKCAVIIDLDAIPDSECVPPPVDGVEGGAKPPPALLISMNNTSKNRARKRRQCAVMQQRREEEERNKKRVSAPEKCGECGTALDLFNTFVGADCRHAFCQDCVLVYLLGMEVVPIHCMRQSCQNELHSHAVLNVLETASSVTDVHRAARERLQQLYVKKQAISRLAYCANSACATPFDWEPGVHMNDFQASRIRCPLCHTDTCARCEVRWHEGRTCAENMVHVEHKRNGCGNSMRSIATGDEGATSSHSGQSFSQLDAFVTQGPSPPALHTTTTTSTTAAPVPANAAIILPHPEFLPPNFDMEEEEEYDEDYKDEDYVDEDDDDEDDNDSDYKDESKDHSSNSDYD